MAKRRDVRVALATASVDVTIRKQLTVTAATKKIIIGSGCVGAIVYAKKTFRMKSVHWMCECVIKPSELES